MSTKKHNLLDSVQEMAAVMRGEAEPARVWSTVVPDAAKIRGGTGLSQQEFAALLGISVNTLQNWEQGRRKPEGPARVLLQVAAMNQKAVRDAARALLHEVPVTAWKNERRQVTPRKTKAVAARIARGAAVNTNGTHRTAALVARGGK